MTAPSSDASSGDPRPDGDPIRLSQKAMRTPLPRRFYAKADAVLRDGRFAIELDGKLTRTPGKNRLEVPTRAAAEAIAAEWQGQGETIVPASMPMTRLANSAIDGVARDPAPVRAEIVRYASCDLLCYRAGEPEKLVARQAASWDPPLAWAHATLGARFVLSQGIAHVTQPPEALDVVEQAVAEVEAPFALAALNLITVLGGSAVLALAVARRRLTAEEAWAAAHVDEDFQIEAWGEDAEATARRASRWRDFSAAARLLEALEKS